MAELIDFLSSGWGIFVSAAAGIGIIVAFSKNIKSIAAKIHQAH